MKHRLLITLTVLLMAVGLYLRVYNYTDRVVFTLEQGITLTTTYDYIHTKLTLLGLPSAQRYVSNGQQIFFGPLYNYLLIPVMQIVGLNPISITYFSLFLNLSAAGALFCVAKRLAGWRTALFATALFLFDPQMISQSLTIWILNPLPLMGVMGLYLVDLYRRERQPWTLAGIGLLGGSLISLEYVGLFTVMILFPYLVYLSQERLKTSLYLAFFASLPLLPTLVFDLKHDWYHWRTLYQYLLDTIANPGQGSLQLYHFYHLFPVVAYWAGLILAKISRTRLMPVTLFLLVLAFNRGFSETTKIPTAKAESLIEVGEVIAQSAQSEYNIVYLPDSEYRAHAMRYILDKMLGVPPMAVDAYPSSSEVYVITTRELGLIYPYPWEITSFQPKDHVHIYTSKDSELLLFRFRK